MKSKILFILSWLFCLNIIHAENDKIPIPPDQGWSTTKNRENTEYYLSIYQGCNYVIALFAVE